MNSTAAHLQRRVRHLPVTQATNEPLMNDGMDFVFLLSQLEESKLTRLFRHLVDAPDGLNRAAVPLDLPDAELYLKITGEVSSLRSWAIGQFFQIAQLPVVCAVPVKTLKKFVSGAVSFGDAFEVAQEAGGDNTYLKRLAKFRTWLVRDEVGKALTKAEGQARAQILYELEKIHTRAQVLTKNLREQLS